MHMQIWLCSDLRVELLLHILRYLNFIIPFRPSEFFDFLTFWLFRQLSMNTTRNDDGGDSSADNGQPSDAESFQIEQCKGYECGVHNKTKSLTITVYTYTAYNIRWTGEGSRKNVSFYLHAAHSASTPKRTNSWLETVRLKAAHRARRPSHIH